MEYETGYVAFIDVLGFSTYVLEENNKERTKKLFEFIEKFCYIFNVNGEKTGRDLGVRVAFFSDSMIVSAKKLGDLVIPIILAEEYLSSQLGLLFRGGISCGKYYHNRGTTFGPAVISAYQLEKKAIYSRVIIERT